jgi:hypothetical protein
MDTVLAVNIRHYQRRDYCWRFPYVPYANRQHCVFYKYRSAPSSQQPSNGVVPERSSGKAPKTPNLGGKVLLSIFLEVAI